MFRFTPWALLGEQLRLEYSQGRRKALVLYRSKMYERRIFLPEDHVLEVVDADLVPHLKVDERMLVVVPGRGRTRFVVQAAVGKIFSDRFAVRILDPRRDPRFKVSRVVGTIQCWPMPATVSCNLQNAEVTLVRNIACETAKEGGLSEVREDLMDPKNGQPALEFQNIIAGPAVILHALVDISLGGACMVAPAGEGENLLNQLVFLRFLLNGKGAYSAGLRLGTMAIVRGWKKAKAGDHLHLMFLARLPDSVAGLFSSGQTT